ncbi:MAG: thiamine diphosphokinase [Clostridiales bacterium]|nr:thiamine diphosphokinase [Clostridiales bacterium]
MKRICCIVGAGDMSETRLIIPDGAYVIAADAGLEHLDRAGIVPDLIVGDFDSLGKVPEGSNIIEHAPEKDDTDMMLAVKEALARGADTIIIYGGLGGRLDHVFANMQTLAFIANQGARGYLVGCGIVCTAIKNGTISFDADMRGVVSVFCLGDTARGVDLVGLKYPLSDHTMTCDMPLGVSNEFMGVPSLVSVRDGILAVMWGAPQIELEKYII